MSLWRPLLVMGMLLLASALLVVSMRMPLLYIHFEPVFPPWLPDLMGAHAQLREWLLKTSGIPAGPQYFLRVVQRFWLDGAWGLSILIVVFWVVFPILKIILGLGLSLGTLWLAEDRLSWGLWVLAWLRRWSLADLSIAGFLLVYFAPATDLVRYEVGLGLGAYAVAAILMSWAVAILHRHHALQRRQRRDQMVVYLFGQGRELRDASGGDAIRAAAVFLRDEPLSGA